MYRRQKSNIHGAAAPFKAPRMANHASAGRSSSSSSTPSSAHSSSPVPVRSNSPPMTTNTTKLSSAITQDLSEDLLPLSSKPVVSPTPVLRLQKRMLTSSPNPSHQPKQIKLSTPEPNPSSSNRYFEIVWRKQTMKKNKTWDGDGIAVLTPNHISLRKCATESSNVAPNYKEFSRNSKVTKFTTDEVFTMGMFEVEVMCEITDSETLDKIRGKLGTTMEPVPFVKTTTIEGKPSSATTNMKNFKPHVLSTPLKRSIPLNKRQFKPMTPSENNSILATTNIKRHKLGEPLYDATLPDSIIFDKINKDDIDVVIDPYLAKNLRPHQIKGVKFLYDCVLRGKGALLADDMGLGKTLQTITLLWTLLKQSPFPEDGFRNPVVCKVLIACPVTLIGNWKREFKKWLPSNRVGVLTLNSKGNGGSLARDRQDLKGFGNGKVYQVLIMGYEKIVNMQEDLKREISFDILVCDEGHRLKSNSNKTLQALNSLDIQRKILLTGTPIQNDLSEFFNIIDFINPGIVGSFAYFKKHFMAPILKSREINVTNESVIELGNDRSSELIQLTRPFILRRTASVLAKHLPPRTDILVFCPPTKPQLQLFHEVLNSHSFNSLISNSGSGGTITSTLALITMFKKICNSPSLVTQDKTFTDLKLSSTNSVHLSSGKLNLLVQLLTEFRKLGEKVVIVSNYTQTLDIIQSILLTMNEPFSRLDGSTPSKDRDSIVLKFNKTTSDQQFAFLLSAKSGGVGLNLIGASRLILFDSDWNPAVDVQAMARIHRDGQTRPVFIYRLLTTGTLDERIMMRQLMKGQLSERFLDEGKDATDDLFEWKDLKDLFSVRPGGTLGGKDKGCVMHELMGCSCDGIGEVLDEDEGEEEEGEENRLKPLSNGWTSALLVKTASDLNSEILESEKRKNIKKCLVGYRHVYPLNFLEKDSDGLPMSMDYGDSVIEKLIQQEKTRKLINYVMWKTNDIIN